MMISPKEITMPMMMTDDDDNDTGGVEYDDGDENRCQMPRKWDEGGGVWCRPPRLNLRLEIKPNQLNQLFETFLRMFLS